MYTIKKIEMIPVLGADSLESVAYLTAGDYFYSMPFISQNEKKIKWFLSRGEAIDYMEEHIFPLYQDCGNIDILFEIVDFIYISIHEEVTK